MTISKFANCKPANINRISTAMHIGKKIKILRHYKGLSQEALAEKVNKTRALISHIEQTGKASHYTLQLILKTIGVTAEELESISDKNYFSQMPKATEEIQELQERLENYQKENKMLKELVESQKKIIQLMEKKSGGK